jgi:phosphatidyl-myo-inositol dimannoside synthase
VNILFVAPDMFGAHGGIARYSRLALKAMTESSQVHMVDVISLHDSSGCPPDGRYFGSRGRSYTACEGDRRALVYAVTRAFLQTRYDLVIAAHVNLSPVLLILAPLQRSAARVTLVYGTDSWIRLPWLRRLALRQSQLVVAISRHTADRTTRANRLDPRKVDVVPGGVDPHLAEASASREVPDDFGQPVLGKNSLLTVARLSSLEASKGHRTVLRSLPRVLASVPDVTYHIVGEGDLGPSLQRLACELGIERHVRFHGALSDRDLRRCYRSCTAFVMPSIWEGFGLVFLEAMAYARPIVAANRDGAPDVLGDAALLVDPNDAEQLAQKLITLLSNPLLRAHLGQAGRARLDEHFTYDRFRSSFLRSLQASAARGGPPRPGLALADGGP